MAPPARDPQAGRQPQSQQQKKAQGAQGSSQVAQLSDGGATGQQPLQQSQPDGGGMELGGSQHGNPHRSGTTLMLGNFEGHAKKFLDGETSKCKKESLFFL
jgi:hypothetical protein